MAPIPLPRLRRASTPVLRLPALSSSSDRCTRASRYSPWLPIFYGELEVSTAFAPRDWHVHEMLYGYLTAVIAGFLLTAVPNWTGRMPLQGKPLLVLVSAWGLGRIAVSVSAWIGWFPALVADVSFLLLLAGAAGREIAAGRNWRNLKVLVLGLLLVGNLIFHLEARLYGAAEYGARLGIAATIMLVMLIGGRIDASFTRNWLARRGPGRLPAPFGTFDMVSSPAPEPHSSAGLRLPTGVSRELPWSVQVCCRRAPVRWAGRTWRDRLVLILHVAYSFVPVGFVLVGMASLGLRSRQRGNACLDGRRAGRHDPGGDVPCQFRPYGGGRSSRRARPRPSTLSCCWLPLRDCAPTAVEHEFASCFGSRLGSRLPGLRGDVLAGADRTARRTMPLFDMEQGAGRGAIYPLRMKPRGGVHECCCKTEAMAEGLDGRADIRAAWRRRARRAGA